MRVVNGERETRIIAYFEHERCDSVNWVVDLEKMVKMGITHLVVCLSEETLLREDRLSCVGKLVTAAREKGIECWADPWHLGKVFGGEGVSYFDSKSNIPCFCGKEFSSLMAKWLLTVKELGFGGVFWDEPEPKCNKHDLVAFINRFSYFAKMLGLKNVVCVTADERETWLIDALASLIHTDIIAVDPYWPNAFVDVPEKQRREYVRKWVNRIKAAGLKAGKSWHVWVQAFNIREGDEKMMNEFAQIIREEGGGVAIWGWDGCRTLFPKTEGIASANALVKEIEEIFA